MFEIRSPETVGPVELTLAQVLGIRAFGIRISLGFRDSDFEFRNSSFLFAFQ